MAVWLALITCLLSVVGYVSTDQSNNWSPLNSGQDGFAQLNISNQRGFQILTDLLREETQQLRELVMSRTTELQQLQQLQQLQVGKTSLFPAHSCQEIKQKYPSSLSGYYWIQGSGSSGPVRMYCDMTRSCKGVSGGWMRAAYVNMNNHNHSCPAGLKTLTSHGRRRCASPLLTGCRPVTFNIHKIPYTKVCGRVIAYQYASTDAFWQYYNDRSLTIDDSYVDGASLTHGHYPRQHIWTFAAALDEQHRILGDYSYCPCSSSHSADTYIPPFVGNDYFCDSAPNGPFQYVFYADDPLWNGHGCGSESTCCTFNQPPWFMKELQYGTTNDLELRVCRNRDNTNEDIHLKIIELYVQ